MGVLTMLLNITNSYPVLIVFCVGLGLADGCFWVVEGPIAYDICGPSGAAQAIGFLKGLLARYERFLHAHLQSACEAAHAILALPLFDRSVYEFSRLQSSKIVQLIAAYASGGGGCYVAFLLLPHRQKFDWGWQGSMLHIFSDLYVDLVTQI